ncbi:MAG: ARC6/PARC6 family protein [Crocosphaera sp.]
MLYFLPYLIPIGLLSCEEIKNSLGSFSSPIQSPIVTNHPSPSPNSSSLTQQKAVDLVANWYRAKPNMFGGSFDTSLVSEYATGTLYYETLERDGGGSIGWLQRNGCYYTYEFSKINNVVSFNFSGLPPSLTINVSERVQLHGPSSAGCGNPPRTYTKNVTYWFTQDNGIWKIGRDSID